MCIVKYITRKVKKTCKKHRNLGNFNHCSIMGYSWKMETTLVILMLIRKENLLKEIKLSHFFKLP